MSAVAPPSSLADAGAGPEPASASPRRRLGSGVAWLLLIVALPLARLAVFLAKPAALQQREFTDDFYYYALIARHLADGAGSTFGGLVDTNGYQPLWQLMLVPVAWLADGDAFLRLVYGLQAILFALTLALAWLIARRVGASRAGAYAAAWAAGLGMNAGNLFFQGMEIVVLLPLLLAVILAVLAAADPRRPARPVRDGLVLGGLLVLLALARLDTLAFPAVLGLVVLAHREVRRRLLGTLLVAAGVVAAGLAAYAAANLALFGVPVPVSGLAKALGGGGLRGDLVAQYLDFGVVGPVPTVLGLQAPVVVVAALVLIRRAAARGREVLGWADRPVGALLVALLVAQLGQLAYYTLTSSWPLWPWYFYYVPVTLLVGLLVVVRAVLGTRAGAAADRPAPAVAAGLAACGLAVGATWGPPPAAWWDTGVPAAAGWVTAHTAPSDVVAVGDRAGYLSWLTRRPTVQLEGLVQDRGYLDVLADHRIGRYLRDQHVRWYVRGDDLPGVPPSPAGGQGCAGYDEPAMGGGPKSVVEACDGDLVYDDAAADYRWRIWRYQD